jgi:hypothetical protein
MFLPQCDRPSFAPIQNNRKNYSSVYLELCICLGKHVTVFQAEIYAILACTYEIQANARSEKYISICSDSQAALKALQTVRHSATQNTYPPTTKHKDSQHRVHNSLPVVRIMNQSTSSPTHDYLTGYFNIILPDTPMSPPFRFTNWISERYIHRSHAHYMTCPSKTPRFSHHNNISGTVQMLKLFIMYLSVASGHFLSIESHYLPTHPVLEPGTAVFASCETPNKR